MTPRTSQDPELSAALHRIADQNTPVADPTPEVVRRAGRLRKRRIAGTAVVGAAVVALAVPVGISLLPAAPGSNVATTTTTEATPTTAVAGPVSQATRGPDGVLETTLDFAKLPRGEAPKVPWYSDGVIHDGDREIPFRGVANVDSLHEVSGGYLVLADYEGEFTSNRELLLVKPDGTRQSLDRENGGLIFEPAVSDDGNRIAWSRYSGDFGSRMTIELRMAAASGRPLHKKQIAGGEESLLEVRAFLGSKVLVNRATNAASKPVKLWDPPSGSLADWRDSYDVAGTTTDRSLVAVKTSGSRSEGCFAVLALPGQRQLWRSCDFNHNDVYFAPTRYVAASNVDNHAVELPRIRTATPESGEEPPAPKLTSSLNILTAETGEPVLRIKDQAPYQVAWESDDTVLFAAYDKSREREALVRCTTTGACELAAEPRSRTAVPPHGLDTAPYAIAIRR